MRFTRCLRPIVILCALMCVLAGVLQAAVAWASGPFQVLSTTATRFENLQYVEMVVQNGSHPLNRFKVHRVVQRHVPAHALQQSIILMPSLADTFAEYMVGIAPGGKGGSL